MTSDHRRLDLSAFDEEMKDDMIERENSAASAKHAEIQIASRYIHENQEINWGKYAEVQVKRAAHLNDASTRNTQKKASDNSSIYTHNGPASRRRHGRRETSLAVGIRGGRQGDVDGKRQKKRSEERRSEK